MLTIRKTGEGYYLATIEGKFQELDRNSCHFIKKELQEIMKPHREISLNVKGIVKIDNGGFKILQELKNLMDHKKCKLRFINVEASMSKKFAELSGKMQKEHSEIE